MRRHFRVFDEAFAGTDHLICYAMKALSNLSILKLFASMGSGFDIVSVGEMMRCLRAGADPRKIVFSGVGKTDEEMAAALDANILMINVESRGELHRISEVAGRMKKHAPVSLRVNPDLDPGTHPHISTGHRDSKFGIPCRRSTSTTPRQKICPTWSWSASARISDRKSPKPRRSLRRETN